MRGVDFHHDLLLHQLDRQQRDVLRVVQPGVRVALELHVEMLQHVEQARRLHRPEMVDEHLADVDPLREHRGSCDPLALAIALKELGQVPGAVGEEGRGGGGGCQAKLGGRTRGTSGEGLGVGRQHEGGLSGTG